MAKQPDPQELRELFTQIIDAQQKLNEEIIKLSQSLQKTGILGGELEETANNDEEYEKVTYELAKAFVAKEQVASVGFLQKRLQITYQEAKEVITRLEKEKHVGKKKDDFARREVFISLDDVLIPTATASELSEGFFFEISDDDLYEDAKQIVIQTGKASISLLQRTLRIGYGRATRILDMLEDNGIIGPQDGANPRDVYG